LIVSGLKKKLSPHFPKPNHHGYLVTGAMHISTLDVCCRALFTIEVWTPRGLQRVIVLFFMELATRQVEIAGVAALPNKLWMSQIGRNLTDADGILRGKRFLIHDRDPLFTSESCR
jgi:hypothetical protein